MRKVFKTDFTRGNVIAFFVALLIPSVFLFFFHQGFHWVLKENALWYSSSISNILPKEQFIVNVLEGHPTKDISRTLTQLAWDPSVKRISLLDKANRLLISSDPGSEHVFSISSSAWKVIEQGQEGVFLNEADTEITTVIPYMENGIYSGSCIIQFDTEVLRHRIKKYYFLVLFLVVVLAVSVFKLLSSVLFYHYKDKRREQFLKGELNQSYRMLKQILKTAPVGMCLVRNRKFQWINREMLRQFRLSDYSDFIGESTRIIFGSESAYEEAGKTIYHSDENDCTMCDMEIQALRKDGTEFPAKVFWNFIDPGDKDKGAIVIIIDVSVHKSILSRKIHEEKTDALLELAGAISHELSQPIQYISSVTELAMKEMDPGTTLYNQFEKIMKKIEKLNSITENLKSITRYETKEYVRGKKIVDLDKSTER